MRKTILGAGELSRALSIPDLTEAAHGRHAMQLLLEDIIKNLARAWDCAVIVHRASPIVSIKDNYDRLHYPKEGVTRDARYTRYVSRRTLLRTHTSAMIPPLLRQLSKRHTVAEDTLLVCPGLVYRRDCIDRLHTGEPHQLDLWRIRRGRSLEEKDLVEMIRVVCQAALPGADWRTNETEHPYTVGGLEIEARSVATAAWVEIGECGLALPALLEESGCDLTVTSGLAMGLGLDRILMTRKGLDDIRLLRSRHPTVQSQLLDLKPYRRVSNQPAVRRDMSICVDDELVAEELGDKVRTVLAERAELVESIEILSETPLQKLPARARARLGIKPGQKNVLLRVVLRDLHRSLTHGESNDLRNEIYRALHEGKSNEWAITPAART